MSITPSDCVNSRLYVTFRQKIKRKMLPIISRRWLLAAELQPFICQIYTTCWFNELHSFGVYSNEAYGAKLIFICRHGVDCCEDKPLFEDFGTNVVIIMASFYEPKRTIEVAIHPLAANSHSITVNVFVAQWILPFHISTQKNYVFCRFIDSRCL